MATAKKRRRRKNTKRDNLIVYSILAAIFFAGFFVGRITKQPETIIVPTVEETVLATEVERSLSRKQSLLKRPNPKNRSFTLIALSMKNSKITYLNSAKRRKYRRVS